MKTIPIVPFEGPFITNNFNNRLDVELILFSQCNLHCKHCKVKGLNNVFDKKLIIQQGEWAVQAIKSARYKCKHVEVHITGGELFQDHLDWSVYEEVIGKIETALKNTKRTYTIGLTSNLTTHRIEDVITMFKKHSNWELSTSFDFAGRFSSDDLDTWVSNILALHDHGIRLLPISIVQHLPSLKAIKKGSSKTLSVFDDLYNSGIFQFEVSDYEDVHKLEEYNPSKDEKFEFDKWFVDNYPDVIPFNRYADAIKHNHIISMIDGCPIETLDINSYGPTYECCDKINCMKNARLLKHCALCVYQQYCSINCPNAFINMFPNDDYCPQSRLFAYIEQKVKNE